MTYDMQRSSNPQATCTINWGFYRGAWALGAISSALNVATNLILWEASSNSAAADTEPGQTSSELTVPPSTKTLSLLSLGFGIAADALFTTSVANSLAYTKDAEQRLGSGIDFQLSPILSGKG